jgi:antitoxin (DNA-binding transcriptional repressor) of toxin-antitoxin stability system
MSHTVSISEAAKRLLELVGTLKPGDEIILTDQNKPVAKLVPSAPPHSRRRAGNCKGMLVIQSEDDDHLKDFSEYMK